MVKQFKRHIDQILGTSFKGKILATVSGGVDSVVLCYLLKSADIDFSIAHCNFQLRDEESQKDELFVEKLSSNLGVPYYAKSFETNTYAEKNGISIQMAARDLRYNWFSEIREKCNYDLISTAHHKNDNVETVLLNLVRGTGHKGLVGMKSLSQGIVRPLLSFTKEELLGYASTNNIEWREDASNESNKYKRNHIRNNIIPQFEELNPNFIHTFTENIEKFSLESAILNSQIKNYGSSLPFSTLNDEVEPIYAIWNWISPFGFTFSDAKDVFDSLSAQSGKKFISSTHQIVKDRNEFIVSENSDQIVEEEIIYKIGKHKLRGCQLNLSEELFVDYSLGENFAYFNADKLELPLKVRRWKNGDKFKPLGMKGSKLVSDFLVDEKVSVIEKETQLVLESKKGIAWVIGRRVSEDFKVFDESNVIKIEFSQ